MKCQGRILLADDEDTFAKATQSLFQDEGFQCHTVGDANGLTLALEESAYDLLITDLKMPGNREMEMIQVIKARLKTLPVIVVTGYPSIASAVDSVRLNVLEYIVKPVEYPYLLECVRKGMQWRQNMQMVRSRNILTPQRMEQFENVQHTLHREGNAGGTSLHEESSQVHDLAELYTQLQEIIEHFQATLTPPPQEQDEVYSQAIITDYLQLRAAIFETIQVLQKTKGSFRSKELGTLRQRLQDLLKQTVTDS